MQTYFADPYSSWQRGTNEYTNGLLRRYFPKRTDFRDVSQDEINAVVHRLNNIPRKVLCYKTPSEVFTEQLSDLFQAAQFRQCTRIASSFQRLLFCDFFSLLMIKIITHITKYHSKKLRMGYTITN
jgi:hypothetical protein